MTLANEARKKGIVLKVQELKNRIEKMLFEEDDIVDDISDALIDFEAEIDKISSGRVRAEGGGKTSKWETIVKYKTAFDGLSYALIDWAMDQHEITELKDLCRRYNSPIASGQMATSLMVSGRIWESLPKNSKMKHIAWWHGASNLINSDVLTEDEMDA